MARNCVRTSLDATRVSTSCSYAWQAWPRRQFPFRRRLVRSWRGAPFDRLLGLDVGPYAGFSGSAIVLPDGGLAGIATAGIFRGQGLGVPSAMLHQTLDALEQHGTIKRGYLGVTSQPVRLPARQRAGGSLETGLLVLGIAPDSPAEAAGLLVGDVLVGFDGHDVDDPETLLGLLTADRVGRAVPLSLVRGGSAQQVTVSVGERAAGE
jgi:S1-C subfamily serine protease